MDSIEPNPTLDLPAETLAVLTEISREINSSLNLDDVLASAAAQVKRLIDFEIFAVLLVDDSANNLYFRFAIGHRREVIAHWRIPVGDGIIGAAAGTGQAIRVGDVLKDPRYLAAVECGPLRTRGAADRAGPRDRSDGYREPPDRLLHARPAERSDPRCQPHRHGG